MSQDLLTKDFFDLKDFEFKEIFDEEVWESISNIPAFLEKLFKARQFTGKVFIEESAEVDPTAKILGPAYIGKGAKVRFNAYIRENVIVGENSIIGHAVEIKNSIVLNNSTIAHFNHIAESIIGSNVNFAAGSHVANLRLDNKTVMMDLGGQKIDTGLKKFGAIVGDNSKIGANSVLNPGTVLGKACVVYPLTQVSGSHSNNSIIK